MKIIRISFSSNQFLKVRCHKTEVNEINKITSELVQRAIIKYRIELINDPRKVIKEVYRINNKDIEFVGNDCIILALPIDTLHEFEECQVNIISIAFIGNQGNKFLIFINHVSTFLEIQKCNEEHLQSLDNNKLKKEATILKETLYPGTKKEVNTHYYRKKPNNHTKFLHKKCKHLSKPSPYETQLFTDSYEKFKIKVQDSKLIRDKPDSIHLNIKKFGMSLLGKILLFVKYLNVLVGNEFQKDLHEFLKNQISENIVKEVIA